MKRPSVSLSRDPALRPAANCVRRLLRFDVHQRALVLAGPPSALVCTMAPGLAPGSGCLHGITWPIHAVGTRKWHRAHTRLVCLRPSCCRRRRRRRRRRRLRARPGRMHAGRFRSGAPTRSEPGDARSTMPLPACCASGSTMAGQQHQHTTTLLFHPEPDSARLSQRGSRRSLGGRAGDMPATVKLDTIRARVGTHPRLHLVARLARSGHGDDRS